MTPPTLACSREALLDAAVHLPAAPQVLAELNELLLNPHLQLHDLATVLRRDAALASVMVRIANSALYGGGRVSSIEDAVARLGMAEVFRATGLATTARFSEFALPSYGISAKGAGRASLLHALALESLAPFVRIDPLVGYTTGLLRPLGLMIIDHLLRSRGTSVVPPATLAALGEAENAWVGARSGEVAARVLEEWHFSADMVAAVRDQYLPAGPAAASPLAVALNVAGSLVASLDGALPAEAEAWQRTPAKLESLGLTEEHVHFAQERTAREFERQRFVLE